jgi:ATP-dependent 26S proteasome regulatory subunit
VIALRLDDQRQMHVDFHRLPSISREDIILPAGLLDRIERLTVGFARHSNVLKAAGCHLKRGLLLFGPPGTGKTLTAMHLAGRMPDRTVLLLTGGGLGLIEESCALARALQPATLILEDVDLIAEERAHQNKACNTVLFELLNQMDGLADDADILFLLTTNRPDMLEPALASRPGRIDQALEVPLPDEAGRRRLLSLYGRGFELAITDEGKLLQRTEGVSAAFVRELVRKAALFAAEESVLASRSSSEKLTLRDAHFEEAVRELVVHGGELTKSLLGAKGMAEVGS